MINLRSERAFILLKYLLIILTALTIIATFVAYGVVVGASNTPAWHGLIITYLIILDLVSLIGLFGAIREHHCLVQSYAITITVLWWFNWFNFALRERNVFAYLVMIGVIVTAFIFAHCIKLKRIHGGFLDQAHMVNFPNAYPEIHSNHGSTSVIHVTPTYVPPPNSSFTPSALHQPPSAYFPQQRQPNEQYQRTQQYQPPSYAETQINSSGAQAFPDSPPLIAASGHSYQSS